MSSVAEGTRSALAASSVLTAFNLAAALNVCGIQMEILGDHYDCDPPDPELDDEIALFSRLERLAASRYNSHILEPEDLRWVEDTLANARLKIHRSGWSSETALASEGWVERVHDIVAKHRFFTPGTVEFPDKTYYVDDPHLISKQLFDKVVAEGVVSWALSDSEVRRCAWCGEWFQPAMRDRKRFDSDDCRKAFSNRAASNDVDKSSFECALCGNAYNLQHFSGLRLDGEKDESDEGQPIKLGMCAFSSSNPVCVECVKTRAPGWRRYLTPIIGVDR